MLIIAGWMKYWIGLDTFKICRKEKIILDDKKLCWMNFHPTFICFIQRNFHVALVLNGFSSNSMSPVKSIKYLHIFSNELNIPPLTTAYFLGGNEIIYMFQNKFKVLCTHPKHCFKLYAIFDHHLWYCNTSPFFSFIYLFVIYCWWK